MTDALDFFAITVEQTDWRHSAAELTNIRHQVFVVEQGVPESEEVDDHDPTARHWIARDAGNRALGTARLVGNKVGRMAVLREFRGHGVGGSLLRAIIEHAGREGLDTLVLGAQTHAAPFYQGAGFRVAGLQFIDAGIPHLPMTLELKRFDRRPVAAPPAVEATHRAPVAVASAAGFAGQALALATAAERSLRLFSDRLAPEIYDDAGFCTAVRRLATRHPHTATMILVRDSRPLAGHSHRLVELFLRLTSRIELRRLDPEYHTEHSEFLIGDDAMVLCNQIQDGYRGHYWRHAPREARRLTADFDALWAAGAADPALRRLHI
jgi:predicted GNAT family N-acyltransferase